MKALFHLAADMDIEVESVPAAKTVFFRVIHPSFEGPRHVERELAFSKAETRSIASAMMGCASDIG